MLEISACANLGHTSEFIHECIQQASTTIGMNGDIDSEWCSRKRACLTIVFYLMFLFWSMMYKKLIAIKVSARFIYNWTEENVSTENNNTSWYTRYKVVFIVSLLCRIYTSMRYLDKQQASLTRIWYAEE